jgi:hypothetical protein
MLAPVARLRDGVLRLGSRPADRPEVRVRKEALVLTAVAITVLATLWVATYLLLDRPLSAAVPFAYQVISIVSLVYFARTGNIAALRLTQVSVMLVLPFVLQWTLGGFANSSAVMVWAFAAPVGAAAEMALAMLPATAEVATEVGRPLELRVGIHAGPAMAGVIGRRKFAYDLWGDAVNVASRMESHGVPGRVQVSQAVASALGGEYRFEDRGTIDIKGLGAMHTYFLLGPA